MQALGPAAIMVYLELSLLAISMALCAGLVVAGLAAWGTSGSADEAPVGISSGPFFIHSLVKGLHCSSALYRLQVLCSNASIVWSRPGRTATCKAAGRVQQSHDS